MIRPGDVFLLADNVGIAAFAITGMLTGIRHRLDIIGILTAGYLTAFGGGIMRDAMIGRIPYVFQDPVPSSVATISVLLVLAFYFMKKGRASRIEQSRITIFFDAIGLSSFFDCGRSACYRQRSESFRSRMDRLYNGHRRRHGARYAFEPRSEAAFYGVLRNDLNPHRPSALFVIKIRPA